MELLGLYSNQDIVDRLRQVLAGSDQGGPSTRTVRSYQRQRRLTKDEVGQLLDAYDDGATIDQLADQFSLHRTTVLRHLEREGADRRWGAMARHLDEAIQLYEQGWSTAKIGKHFGVSHDTVRLHLIRAGIPMRKPWERG